MTQRTWWIALAGGALGAAVATAAATLHAGAQPRAGSYRECFSFAVPQQSSDLRREPTRATPIPPGWTLVGVVEGPTIVLCR